ncbi:MAG: cytochrome c oxidase accessory protein CcoG [Rhodospirillales bacterium]|nr:cytochrome c oxidase accessory protein CcoG [Rhodospirillales bacterium]
MSTAQTSSPEPEENVKSVSPTMSAEVSGDQPMYAGRPEIYPRSVSGSFRTLKWTSLWVLLGIYHVLPWLRWDRGEGFPNQAILLDIGAGRGYIFGIEIWPQEVYYLTGILIIAAVGLFFATSLFGRVWCGFACPQTVWTDLYFWVEKVIEGDRNQRLKLDRGKMTLMKAVKKVTKHVVWLLIAFLMSFAWVWYFNDAPTVTREILTGQAGGWVLTFIGMLTFMTYLLAGWAREQVCFYMCPWPRFQGAMFDEDSLLVTYEEWRGEPRAKPAKGGTNFEGRGHCVDCSACVQVCPTGIDIRDGSQMECIGCALCVDACNAVMDRFNLPRGLITYDSNNNQLARSKNSETKLRLIRPRTIGYMAIMLLVLLVMVVSLATRTRMEINVLHDRSPLYVNLSDGSIRNGYTFKILNMENVKKDYVLSVEGVEGATMTVIGIEKNGAKEVALPVEPDQVVPFQVYVRAERSALAGSSNDMTFILKDTHTGVVVTHESVFRGPEH